MYDNTLIVDDNINALKLLQKDYTDKIKMRKTGKRKDRF